MLHAVWPMSTVRLFEHQGNSIYVFVLFKGVAMEKENTSKTRCVLFLLFGWKMQ